MLGHAPLATAPLAASSEPAPLYGAADFTGTATLSASARVIASGAAAMTGTATVIAFGGFLATGRAAMTGTATMTATGIRRHPGSASFGGTAQLAGFGGLIHRSRAAMTGVAELDAFAVSLIGDLFENPRRRPVYTIEIDPWLIVPYDEAS